MRKQADLKGWEWEYTPRASSWGWNFGELYAYRSLLFRLVRRDFLLNYQQTVLGPLWILFQPIITLVTYVIVFDKLVGVSTGGVPPVLFYLSGIVLWGFFNDSFLGNAFTFRENVAVFSKVYFPRLIVPMAVLSTHFVRFCFQVVLLIFVMLYFAVSGNYTFHYSPWLFSLPLIILIVGVLGLSLGILFSVLTAKYRDLTNLVHLGVRLLLFLTPVIYPVEIIPEKFRAFVLWNPLTPLFELSRLALFGEGAFLPYMLGYSLLVTVLLFVLATRWFNRVGDKLMDVI